MSLSNLSQDKVESYIHSQSRNKIVVFNELPPEVMPVNVGIAVAHAILPIIGDKRFALKAKSIIEDIFNSALTSHNVYGKILALSNIGILLEPELKLDIISLFDNFSRNNTLFMQCEGEINDRNLFFLTKENGIEININKLSYIAI
jgi:hypothetical protein